MTRIQQQDQARGWQLAFGFFAGPLLWGLQLLAGYGLATVSCSLASKLPVYILLGFSGLIVLAAAIVALGARHARSEDGRSILADTNEAPDSRAFIAVSGFIVSGLFFLLILVTLIVDLFLSPCPLITMPLP